MHTPIMTFVSNVNKENHCDTIAVKALRFLSASSSKRLEVQWPALRRLKHVSPHKYLDAR